MVGCCAINGGAASGNFDFAIIRFNWTTANGRDLDTRTAIVSPTFDNSGVDVGWDRQQLITGASGNYLTWGGDNTTTTGDEAVLVDFLKIIADFPSQPQIDIRLRAFWYGQSYSAGGDASFELEFTTYKGGSMIPDGLDFINVGGVQVDHLTVQRQLTTDQVAANVDGEEIGHLIYTVATHNAIITTP